MLLPDTDVAIAGALFAMAIAGSGFVQGITGFGYAVVALALLPYLFDVRLANLVVSFSILLPLVYAVVRHRGDIHADTLTGALAGAVLGLPLGLWAFLYVDARWLQRATGFLILIVALDGLRRHSACVVPNAKSRWQSLTAGAVSGFLCGSIGVVGPPTAMYAARQPWSPEQFKAFIAAFSLIVTLAKIVGLITTGILDQRVFVLSAIALPFACAGAWMGSVAAPRISVLRFRQLTFAMLTLSSVGMILLWRP
jgi:hypothetical protein